MIDPDQFPIIRRWPARHPDRIQLYAFPTPNGVKASITLEELGLAYEAHKVTLSDDDVRSPEFLSLSPNNKIPAIIDPNGPTGAPIGLFESGAILLYLAEKTGRLIGTGPVEKAHVIQWLMWQMGGIGPMFGQLGYFYKFAGAEIEDPRPRDRYIAEARRLLGVLDRHMQGRDWVVGAGAGDLSVADIAICPWLRALDFYGARDAVGWHERRNLVPYLDRFLDRDAVQIGLVTPPRD